MISGAEEEDDPRREDPAADIHLLGISAEARQVRGKSHQVMAEDDQQHGHAHEQQLES